MPPDSAQGIELDPPFRPTAILRALVEGEVDFVIIGGVAGNAHGSAFITWDMDIAYSREPVNLERVAAALRKIDARLRGPGVPDDLPFQLDAKTLEAGQNFTFATKYGDFDILGEPDGAPPYEQLRAQAPLKSLFGVEVRVASLEHLMRMKRAAGRDKDKLHITEYAELLKLKADGGPR